MTKAASSLLTTRTSVALVFALNGALFATLVSRFPDVRSSLSLSNSELGLLLFGISLGSMTALPISGRLVERYGAATMVRAGAFLVSAGLVVGAVAATVVESTALTALALYVYGLGVSAWDVAMNVEGAEVERQLGRTIMPRFHAAWSFGSIAGSGIGIPMAAWSVPMLAHVAVVVAVCLMFTLARTTSFLPVAPPAPHTGRKPRSAWTEPRTLAIGVMVLAFAMVEGSANDWLTLAVIDGYDTEHWVGVAGFSAFVIAMTAGRLVGPLVLDRLGRAAVLWTCSALGFVGVLLTIFGGSLPVALVGIVIWGLGSSLGFPVGMSAAADDPARAAARVSVVATIGYAAFLAGPPLLGFLGEQVGTLRALLVVAFLMVPAALSVLAARERAPQTEAAR